jgi:hypothetical protein
MATAPVVYNPGSSPTQILQNQRNIYNQQYQQQTGGAPVNTVASSANYLNQIENPLAQGQGGYNASEVSQIELTPEQKQAMITNAGISAGQNTAASTGAADRAAAAAGGNPLALATYRARAAQTQGANAGNAETNAAVAAQQAGSAGAQTVGNARLAQQNQGLQYYQGQNAQANQNAQQANQLQQTAASAQIPASQVPNTFDKIVGGVSGVLGALDKGTMPAGKYAVVGENGPEYIGRPNYLDSGAVPTLPSNSDGSPGLVVPGGQSIYADGKMPNYLDEGTDPMPQDTGADQAVADWATQTNSDANNNALNRTVPGGALTPAAPGAKTPVPFWKRLAATAQSSAPKPDGQQWNTTTPYQQLGSAAGHLLSHLDDGATPAHGERTDQMPDDPYPPAMSVPPRSMLAEGTIVTKPTNVRLAPDEAVIPLSYRANAKVRPSMALNTPKAKSDYRSMAA